MPKENRCVRLHTLANRPNLVDFEQQPIARLLLDGGFDPHRIGDSQVVTDNLNARLGSERDPGLPVVLIEWVLDGDNRVFFDV